MTQVLAHLSAVTLLPTKPLRGLGGACLGFLLGLALNLASTVTFASETRYGTGFFVDSQGHLITALHVVSNSDEINEYIHGNTAPVVANVIKVNAVSDLALLKVQFNGSLAPLTIGTFTETPVGLELFALGHPRPSVQGRSLKITSGLLTSDDGYRGAQNQFQFSAAINTGHSGGPIVNTEGKVIGVAIGRLRSDSVSGSQPISSNIGFALKSEALLRFLSGTATRVTASQIEPSIKKDAVDIFKMTSGSVVFVEAKLSSAQSVPTPPQEKAEQLRGSEPAGPGSVIEKYKQHLQLLINQGFRDPARTTVGFLLVRATGLELPSDSSAKAVEAELMTSMDDGKLDKQQRRYQSSLTRLGFDCSSDRMSILSRSLYTGPFLSGEVIDRQLPQRTEWLKVPSAALKNYLRGSLCHR